MIAFGIPGGWEWIIILAIVLLLFGNRLPSVLRNLGSGITQFKRGLKDDPERQESGDGPSSLGGGGDSSNDGTPR
jgi:sec-independent protein translocase protein TatA